MVDFEEIAKELFKALQKMLDHAEKIYACESKGVYVIDEIPYQQAVKKVGDCEPLFKDPPVLHVYGVSECKTVTGKHEITLDDPYNRLCNKCGTYVDATCIEKEKKRQGI